MLYIKVSGSTSNFGSGFDAFGLALNIHNQFWVETSDSFGVEVEGEAKDLPRDETNLFFRVYRRACQTIGAEAEPIKLRQVNHVPAARGLGSSSTAIVGGILACEGLKGVNLSMQERLRIAFEFEPHPDNLLPAFLGGFVVCATSEQGVSYVRLEFPEELSVVVCIPDFELSTQMAREVLRKEVSLRDAVFNLQRSALFVSAILTRRFELLREAVSDRLHQPYRAGLIPGFLEVIDEAYRAGALAVFLSGAGPSVAALCVEREESVGQTMVQALSRHGVRSKYLVLKPSSEGACIHEVADT